MTGIINGCNVVLWFCISSHYMITTTKLLDLRDFIVAMFSFGMDFVLLS